MNRHIVSAIVTAATVIVIVGCSSTTSMGASGSGSSASSVPSMGSAENDSLCRSLRSYRDRGVTPELQEQCFRQLGLEDCHKCLTAP
ncbi:hypothetical protein GCM10027034_18100 [Ramlibacter solisilvae]|uniref:hypothetical protein n=1 Tax=Ramlibacter tataouinensis TaxID=94132 RepID=UPI0011AE6B42|nr:hypothetical protein [Ramlibacter tataouinensis]